MKEFTTIQQLAEALFFLSISFVLFIGVLALIINRSIAQISKDIKTKIDELKRK